jgi:hypothetical protein
MKIISRLLMMLVNLILKFNKVFSSHSDYLLINNKSLIYSRPEYLLEIAVESANYRLALRFSDELSLTGERDVLRRLDKAMMETITRNKNSINNLPSIQPRLMKASQVYATPRQ